MRVKDEVLRQLEEHRGGFLSGAQLAQTLGVSRNAVWKAVKQLEKEGHQIQAVTNRGYCLAREDTVLSKAAIEKHLTGAAKSLRVQVEPVVTSTNTLIKQQAEEGAPEGLLLAADHQTMGKGRSGRSFFSPSGSGVYFSLLLRPDCSPEDALLVTTAAAVAVAEGMEEVTGKKTGIKWVNDIFCEGKKVCGILTEASVDFETRALTYAVLGIGINVSDPEGGYPSDIASTAGSLYGAEPCPGDVRSRLVAEILSRFMNFYAELSDKAFMKAYRERSIVIGKNVVADYGDRQEQVTVLDIDEDGGLMIQTAGGEKRRMTSGEVRLKI